MLCAAQTRTRTHVRALTRTLSHTYSHTLTELTKRPVEGFSAGLVDDDNIYEWEVMIIGPPDTLYEGAWVTLSCGV